MTTYYNLDRMEPEEYRQSLCVTDHGMRTIYLTEDSSNKLDMGFIYLPVTSICRDMRYVEVKTHGGKIAMYNVHRVFIMKGPWCRLYASYVYGADCAQVGTILYVSPVIEK